MVRVLTAPLPLRLPINAPLPVWAVRDGGLVSSLLLAIRVSWPLPRLYSARLMVTRSVSGIGALVGVLVAMARLLSAVTCKVSGKVGRTGSLPVAVTGSAWLDHEWSSEALQPEATGWDWIGVNLDDGGALMAFQIRSKQGGKLWAHATLRDSAGRVTRYAPDQVNFAPDAHWKSPRTGAEYPVATTVTTGAQRWQLTPLQQDQELDSRRSTGAVYWEGAVTVGRDGKRLGRGYLEMTGYVRPMKL